MFPPQGPHYAWGTLNGLGWSICGEVFEGGANLTVYSIPRIVVEGIAYMRKQQNKNSIVFNKEVPCHAYSVPNCSRTVSTFCLI